MHEEISFVHIPLHECLVLLTVSATDNQIILAGNEPNEFFKPEYLAHVILQLRLLKLCEISCSSGLSLLDCNISSILGLYLLSVRLLLDFKILLNIQLGRDAQVDIDFHDRVEVRNQVLLNFEHLRHRVIFIKCVKH